MFCALTTDQHRSLYNFIYKNVLAEKSFDLKDFSRVMYNKVLAKTNNKELALTYASYIPEYVRDISSRDQEFKLIAKSPKEYFKDLKEVEKFLDIQPAGPIVVDNVPPGGPPPPSDDIFEEPDGKFISEVQYRIQLEEEALVDNVTIEQKFKDKNLFSDNNYLNDMSTKAKNKGLVFFVSSNPAEKISETELKSLSNSLEHIRKKFVDQLASEKLDPDEYRISLQVSSKGFLYGVLTDKNGKIIKFEDNFLSFYLDSDLYSEALIGKKRSEVLKF